MKKILTLFAMSLLSWGMLSAQEGGNLPVVGDLNGSNEVTVDFPEQETVSPKFNLQVVVRDADTLYHDQDVYVSVEISDTAGNSYYESFQKHTSPNGLVSLVIGSTGEADGNLEQIDWSVATVVVEFYESEDSQEPMYSVNIPVTAVPYALQSGSAKLSTEQIAEYAANVLEQADVTEIVNTIVANEELKDAIKAKLLDYLKSADGKANAMKVAEDYLTHLDSINIREVCDALAANAEVKEAVKNLVKQFIMDNRDLAKDLAFWFLEYQVTDNDIERAYNTMMQVSPAVKQAVRTRVKNYLLAQNNRHYLYDLGVYYLGTITEDQALYVYNNYFRFANQNGVKAHLRSGLDEYINGYLALTPNDNHNVEKAATTYATANLLLIPACFSDMTREELVQFICSLQQH